MFKDVIVLSLDSSIDVTLRVPRLIAGGDNNVVSEGYAAGGKAVTIFRTLGSYGAKELLVAVAGQENRKPFENCLLDEGFRFQLVETEGFTRENITVAEDGGGVTRFFREGFAVTHEALEALEGVLREEVKEGTLVVFSGALPKGITNRLLARLCALVHAQGGAVAFDLPSLEEKDVAAIRPWAMKLNREEVSALAGRQLEGRDTLEAYGRTLLEMGVCHCLISLEGDGLLYVGEERTMLVKVPTVNVVSKNGAGDNCFAGFIVGMLQKLPPEKCVKTAAAMGTASCLLEGAGPPKKIATASIMEQLSLLE